MDNNGDMRLNHDSFEFEVYHNGEWLDIGKRNYANLLRVARAGNTMIEDVVPVPYKGYEWEEKHSRSLSKPSRK